MMRLGRDHIRIFWVIAALIVIVAGVAGYALDPPGEKRDPWSLARRFSELAVPDGVSVLTMENEEFAIIGDARLFISLGLTPAEMEALVREAQTKGYRTLPIPSTPDNAIAKYLAPDAKGLYQLRIDARHASNYSLVVLDESTGRLLIYAITV